MVNWQFDDPQDSVVEQATDRVFFWGSPEKIVAWVKQNIPEQEYYAWYVWLGTTATSTSVANYMRQYSQE
jgi:hypothetical protein